MTIIDLTKNNYEKQVFESEETILIDFWACWCAPCKMLSPIVSEVAKEMTDIRVCKVNVDDQPELATKFKVTSLPTLIVMKNGQEVNRSIGCVPKEEVIALVS